MNERLIISRALHSGEREFRLGRFCAYGYVRGGEVYLTHAPDQAAIDAIGAEVLRLGRAGVSGIMRPARGER